VCGCDVMTESLLLLVMYIKGSEMQYADHRVHLLQIGWYVCAWNVLPQLTLFERHAMYTNKCCGHAHPVPTFDQAMKRSHRFAVMYGPAPPMGKLGITLSIACDEEDKRLSMLRFAGEYINQVIVSWHCKHRRQFI
jgi:hypothetical protein